MGVGGLASFGHLLLGRGQDIGDAHTNAGLFILSHLQELSQSVALVRHVELVKVLQNIM